MVRKELTKDEIRKAQYLPSNKLTDEQLIGLLDNRYKPSVIPPCSVCGSKLGIASIGGGEATRYACKKAQGKDGMDWAHYRMSGYSDYRRGGDSDVIQLIKRYVRVKAKKS